MISLKKTYVFASKYADALNEYTDMRSMEVKTSTLNNERWLLEQFDRYICKNTGESQEISGETLTAWLEKRSTEKRITQKKRLNFTKRLCRYLCRRGLCSHIPSLEIRGNDEQGYLPYIFTHGEIAGILEAADSYKSTIRSPYLSLAVPIAFRILYGCGLRVSELVSLRLRDVDTKNAVLSIYGTKFGKSRYVPVSESLNQRIIVYIEKRHGDSDGGTLFLPSPDGRKYSNQAIRRWLGNLLYASGIPHGGRGHGPRVHDLRHYVELIKMVSLWIES